MPLQCEQLKQEYEGIRALKTKFDLEYREAVETGDTKKAKELKTEIEAKIAGLREKLWPFEHLSQKELKEQYESQKEILARVGVLEKLSSGELGIKAIDDKEYAFPKMEDISKMMRENKEILKTKTEQGFVKLLVVPFGMKLDDLIEKYRQVILKHYKEGKLFATKKEPSDPDEPLELDENQPIWVWDQYKNADTEGKLIYFPKEFSQDHQGKTKKEILEKEGGFNILLIEDLANIPRENQGKMIGKRPQIDTKGTSIKKYIKQGETTPSPEEYLKAFGNEPMYQNEIGITPEDQLNYAITLLEETNQVIDDWQGNGSISYQLGAYFFASGNVPSAVWDRGNRQSNLGRDFPGLRIVYCGVRPGVRVKKS